MILNVLRQYMFIFTVGFISFLVFGDDDVTGPGGWG